MLLGLLVPSLTTATTVVVGSAVPALQTTALADRSKKQKNKPPKGKQKGGGQKSDASKSKGSGASKASKMQPSNSGDQQQTSPWDQALQTLAKSAISEDDDQKDANATDSGNIAGKGSTKSKEDEQANIDALGGANGEKTYINAWGFMGKDNSDVWQKNNSSSFHVSYSALQAMWEGQGASDKAPKRAERQKAYAMAGDFAYVMQSTGLDQSVKTGLNPASLADSTAGLFEEISYVLLDNAQKLFAGAMAILQKINPIDWMLNGPTSGPFGPLSSFVNQLYQTIHNPKSGWGVAIIGVILACSLALAGAGVTIGTGQAHVGQGQALLNTLINLLKRFFVWGMLPVFALFLFEDVTSNVTQIFQTNETSVPNYAVFGSIFNYHDAVMNSRLALPSDVTANASFSSKDMSTFKHAQILKLNQESAGEQGLEGLVAQANGKSPADTAKSDANNQGKNAQGKALLDEWRKNSSLTASDFASAVNPAIQRYADQDSDSKSSDSGGSDSGKSDKGSKNDDSSKSSGGGDSDLAQELVKAKYNDNGENNTSGQGLDGGDWTSGVTAGASTMDPIAHGGLSTLGMYAYLLTTADPERLTMVDPENLPNDVAMPGHKDAVLVGTGINHTGNLVWAFGMIVGLAFLTAGYLLETIKTVIEAIPGVTAGTIETAFASLKGGVQLISVVFAMAIGVFGSAIMYLIANYAYLGIADLSDNILSGVQSTGILNKIVLGTSSIAGVSGGPETAALTGVTNQIAVGATNIFEGIFLLYVAWLLLHYRGVVVASLASLVEETANKIMASFGSLTKQGSAGTRGMIMSNTNTSNSVGNAMAGLGRQAGNAAMIAGAAGGLKTLANAGKGLGAASGKKGGNIKGTDRNNTKDKASNRMSQFGNRSSANRQGYASERMMANSDRNNDRSQLSNSLDRRGENRYGNRDQNALQYMDRANDTNGLREAANDNGDRLMQMSNGDRVEELGYQPMTDTARADAMGDGMSNSIGDSIGATTNDANTGENVSNFGDDYGDSGDMLNAGDTSSLENGEMGNQLADSDLDRDGLTNPDDNLAQAKADAGNDQLSPGERVNAESRELANELGVGRGQDMHNSNRLGDQNHANSNLHDRHSANRNNHANASEAKMFGGTTLGANGTQLGQTNGMGIPADANAAANLGNVSANGQVGENMSNNIQSTPVNNNANASTVQARMGDIAQANDLSNRMSTLAANNPDNKTLNTQAQNAQQQLQTLQSGAIQEYNGQSVDAGMPQNDWLGNSVDRSQMSVGTANAAMNHVYDAQQNLQRATDRYGAGTHQVEVAQDKLSQAQADAVKTGLSAEVVGNKDMVNQAHSQISNSMSHLMNGSWTPQNDTSHFSGRSSRAIGI